MRRFAFLAMSSAIFGSAIAYHRQEPKAEEQFKNIQSFKGAKASDIIPAMEFMSAALGVGCDFCHTADRASDEKRAKGTCREMIALQRDINTRNFNGRNQVTCATCHNGHERPTSVPPVAGWSDRARRSPDVNPDQVLAAYAKAVGSDAAHPLDSLHLSGNTTIEGKKVKFDAEYQAGKFAYVIHTAQGDRKFGFNGAVVWFGTPKGTQRIPLVYATPRVNERLYFTGPGSLPKLSNEGGATAKIAGKDQLVVTGQLADESRLALYFDKGTGLLSRSMFTYPTILGNIVQTNDFANYRKIEGVMVPTMVANHDAEGDTTFEIRSVKVDTKIAGPDFEPPK